MIKIYRVALTKERLAAMPSAERGLLLLFGHVANQVTVISKMMLFAQNGHDLPPPAGWVIAAQTHTLVRLVIGTVHEGWEMVRMNFLSSPLGKKYTPMLSKEGTAALEMLKKHFAKDSLLARVRNTYGYHHPKLTDIEAGFNIVSDSEPWDFYLSDHNVNSYYFACDVVTTFGLLSLVGESDPKSALLSLLQTTGKVSSGLYVFIMAVIDVITRQHFPNVKPDDVGDVRNAPRLSKVALPFYVEPS